MSTIYVSGPVTGNEETRIQRFMAVLGELYGPDGFVGFDYASFPGVTLPEDISHVEAMRRRLRVLLDCDAMALLPGWETSRGCLAEYAVACAIGIPVKPIDQWMEGDR